MKKLILLSLVVLLTTTVSATTVLLDDDFSSFSGWNENPFDYFSHGAYNGMYYKMLDDYSTQGYIWQSVGIAGPAGTVYDLDALLTHRIYDNQLAGDTNYSVTGKLAITLDDPTVDRINDVADVVLTVQHQLLLTQAMGLTGGSTDGGGYWDPEIAYSNSYVVDAAHAGLPMYVLIDQGVDLAPLDSGLQSGVAHITLTETVPEPATMLLLGLGGVLLRRRK